MKVQLIKRIREKLKINPQSKSTLLKKSELLEYARQLYEQNKMMKEILSPSLGRQLGNIERQSEQKNTLLVIYQGTLRDEKYKHAMLESSIKHYQAYIEKSQQTRRQRQQRIKELKLIHSGQQKQKLQFSSFQNMINEDIQKGQNGQGEGALLKLMKQFFQVNKSIGSDSSVLQYP